MQNHKTILDYFRESDEIGKKKCAGIIRKDGKDEIIRIDSCRVVATDIEKLRNINPKENYLIGIVKEV